MLPSKLLARRRSAAAGGEAMNQQAWLHAAREVLRPLFPRDCHAAIDGTQVLCSFASERGMAPVHPRQSQSWSRKSPDGHGHLALISPCLDNPVDVLCALAHELCHICSGDLVNHNARFRQFAERVGLRKPLTIPKPSDQLARCARTLVDKIGNYPHQALERDADSASKRKPSHLHLACPRCDVAGWFTPHDLRFGRPFCANRHRMKRVAARRRSPARPVTKT